VTRRALLCAAPAWAQKSRPKILLREALQFENIGDSGRVPGTIRLFDQHLPDAEITLWPWRLHAREREMLLAAFPKLRIAEGDMDASGKASTPALAEAWANSNIFLSPAKSAATYRQWAATGRRYGFFGSAFDPISGRDNQPEGATLESLRQQIDQLPPGAFERKFGSRQLYERASFIFCRDTLSLRFLEKQRVRPGRLAFGPEGCFAIAVRDDRRAEEWLRRHGLQPGGYICVVPRLRFTPYYRVHNLPREKQDYEIDAINDRTVAADHQPLREMIALWVRGTGMKVVACPEMSYQIQTAKEQLVDPLPEEIKRHVVWRDSFWLANEAASIYARARAVVSVECHSPIIALANGTPFLHVRQPVDSVKAHMFHDIGLGDWVHEVGETSGQALWAQLLEIHASPAQAKERVQAALGRVAELQAGMASAVRQAVEVGQA
jgi:hypothetical protein